MGKCPQTPTPSPPAVAGTFPYNVLNGTAGQRLIMLWGFNRRHHRSQVVVTTVRRRRRVANGSERRREHLSTAIPLLYRTLDPER
jgi:hypothetical protein